MKKWVWIWNEQGMPEGALDPVEVEKEYGYFPDLGRAVVLMTEDFKETPIYFDQLPEAEMARVIGKLPQLLEENERLKKALEDIVDFGAKNPGRGYTCGKMAAEVLSTVTD